MVDADPMRAVASALEPTRPRTCAATAAGAFSKQNKSRPGQTLGHNSPDRRIRRAVGCHPRQGIKTAVSGA